MYPSDAEAEDLQRQQNAAKYIGQSIKSTGRTIYILIHESWDHSRNYRGGPDVNTLGAFDSKEAAIAAATNYRETGMELLTILFKSCLAKIMTTLIIATILLKVGSSCNLVASQEKVIMNVSSLKRLIFRNWVQKIV